MAGAGICLFTGAGIWVFFYTLVSSGVMRLPDENWFWHYLTVAFLAGEHRSPAPQWARLASQVRHSLRPSQWDRPSELIAVLHVAEADYCQLLTPNEDIASWWLARQLGARLGLENPDASRLALLRRAAGWLGREGAVRGARIEDLAFRVANGVTELVMTGMAGVGSDTLIQDGDHSGEYFRVTF